MFASLYQQSPTIDSGLIFQREDFEIVSREETGKARKNVVHFFVDTAFTSKETNDPSVVLAATIYQNTVYVIDILRVRMDFSGLVESIEQFYYRYAGNRSIIYVEPKASGQSVTDFLKKKFGVNATEYKLPGGDKVERAHAITGYTGAGRVKLCPGAWNEPFIEELLAFPDGKHDDRVDALVMACTQLLTRRPARRRRRRVFDGTELVKYR